MQVYNGGPLQNYAAGNKASVIRPTLANDSNVFAGSTDSTTSTDSVQLAASLGTLRLADDNCDGVVDRHEMANAAYQLLNDETSTAEEKAVGQMFATMVLGGADEKGLFADFNDDGGVTENELTLLAKGDDVATDITNADFKQAFGTRYKEGGVEFDLADLKALAKAPDKKGQTNEPNNDYGNNNNGYGNNNNPGNANQDTDAQLIQILTGITEILAKLIPSDAKSNGQQSNAQPQNGNGQAQNAPGQPKGNGGQVQGNGGQVPGNGGQVQGNGGQIQGNGQTQNAPGQPKGNGGPQQPNGANGNEGAGNPMMMMMQIFSSLLQMLMKMFAGK